MLSRVGFASDGGRAGTQTGEYGPRIIKRHWIGHVIPLSSPGLPVVTQRDLDGTIACHDQRSSICRWPMRGRTSFVPDACYWTKIQ
jgi:hypothetical protein